MNRAKAEFFDSETQSEWSSRDYDAGELDKIRRVFEVSGIRAGARVIEPGCGSGRLTELIAERIGSSGELVALDISPKMLEQARIRIAGLSNVHVTLGSIEDTPLDCQSYDLALCHNVFPHFDDKRAALLKLVSTLKLSGKFIVSHFMDSSWVNSLHRKTNPAVASDLLPDQENMTKLFDEVGMRIQEFSDDERGYLLKAVFK